MIRIRREGARTSPAAREQDEKTSTSPPSQSEHFFLFLFFFLLFGSAVRVSAHPVHAVPQESHSPGAEKRDNTL